MKLKKKIIKYFLPILLIMLLLFTSCSPQTSDKIEAEESDAKHTEAIQETATPKPTAPPTPEPTATPTPKVEGISFDEETGEVILSNFGEKVFSNCSDYEIIGENKVSFYCEEQGGKCVYDNGTFTSTYPEINIPRAGITPAQYPTFEDKEAVLSYFIDQGDIVAKMIVDGKIKVPFNNDGELVFSDELKQHAEDVFSAFIPDHIAAAEKIVYYQAKAMMENWTNKKGEDPYLFDMDPMLRPFSKRNYIESVTEEILNDETEGHAVAQKLLSAYKGISLTFLLGAFYDGEISSELPQDEFAKYMNRFSEIAQAMEEFRFTYTQESFDEVVRLLENNNCSLAEIVVAKMYWDNLTIYPIAITPTGLVETRNTDETSLNYRGSNYSERVVVYVLSDTLGMAQAVANFSNGSDFNKTFEDIEDQLPIEEGDYKN